MPLKYPGRWAPGNCPRGIPDYIFKEYTTPIYNYKQKKDIINVYPHERNVFRPVIEVLKLKTLKTGEIEHIFYEDTLIQCY